jgi:hypothetical protein
MSHVPYYNGIEPIALPEEYIAIPTGSKSMLYAQIKYIEPIQPFAITTTVNGYSGGNPAVATIGTQQSGITQLQLQEDEEQPGGIVDVAQWRLKLSDFVYLEIDYPSSTPKYTTKNGPTYITPFVKSKDTEFFTYGYRNLPIFRVYNYLPTQLFVKILMYGLKYKTVILPSKPDRYTIVPTISSIAISPGGVQ